jgi:HemY protein
MIRIIILVLVLFGVIALSSLLIDDPGYVLVSLGNHIYEFTVYTPIFWLTALSISGFFTYKILRGSARFSFGAWHKMAFAGQRRGIANFNKGLAAYVLEDYSQAEQLFAKSAVPSKRKQSAYLLAASSSEKLGLVDNTNHYLNLLEQETSKLTEVGLESVIVKVKLLMNQDNKIANNKARALIDEHHKSMGHDERLLSLEIDLCLIEQRYESAITHLMTARKKKSISADIISTWERKAYYGTFKHSIVSHDLAQLESYWQQLGRKLKQRESILLAYCQVLAEHDAFELLATILVPLLKKSPDEALLKRLRDFPIKQADALISIVQKQLHKDIHSAKWLSYLGHLALHSGQYTMAEKAFRSLLNLENETYGVKYDKQDLAALAQALSAQGQHQASNDVWLKASKL